MPKTIERAAKRRTVAGALRRREKAAAHATLPKPPRKERILSMLSAPASLAGYRARNAYSDISSIPDMRRITSDDRALVFAPHCDDETLGAAGLISRAVSAGAAVKVALVTNGDNNVLSTDLQFKTLYPGPKRFTLAGEARQRESIAAMKTLGLDEDDVVFLSYPDRGIKALFTTNWASETPYMSRGTRKRRSVYRLTYDPAAVYSGENLYNNVRSVILDFAPTIVVAPHRNDRHPDHRYTLEFVKLALGNICAGNGCIDKPALITYLVHSSSFPRPLGLRKSAHLLPPQGNNRTTWLRLLFSRAEIDAKLNAIRTYSSQMKSPDLKVLMLSFARSNELFENENF